MNCDAFHVQSSMHLQTRMAGKNVLNMVGMKAIKPKKNKKDKGGGDDSKVKVVARATTKGFGAGSSSSSSSATPVNTNDNDEDNNFEESSSTIEYTTAVQLIEARFEAYKTNNLDFIISTTHEDSGDYRAYHDNIKLKDPIKNWKKDLYKSMTKDYVYVKMELVNQEFVSEFEAKVTFRQLAVRKADNVLYPVEEISILRRKKTDDGSKGAWQYVNGNVIRPPSDITRTMSQDWPTEMGLKLETDTVA